jgi:DNA-binding MarR family transcriptional regulator
MAILTIQACATRSSPGRLIRRVDKVMAGLVEARFEGAGISFVQWIALKVVRDSVVQTAGELARELSITTGATTRMIDVLEAKGFVMRDRGSADRRVVKLAITEAGSAMVEQLQLRVVETWNEVLVDFEQEEVSQVSLFLQKLLAAAERVSGGADHVREFTE